MKRKALASTFIIMLLFSVLAEASFVSLVEANPVPAPPILEIYIRNDGTIDPSTVLIQRAGNIYTFTRDLTNATIIVQRDNIVIDGASHKLQGNGDWWDFAITLENRSNIIIKNIDIRDYARSIQIVESSNIIIYHNSMVTDDV